MKSLTTGETLSLAFLLALAVCLETRNAFLTAHRDVVLFGDCPESERDRLMSRLAEARAFVDETLRAVVVPQEEQSLRDYFDSIRVRIELLEVLFEKGEEAFQQNLTAHQYQTGQQVISEPSAPLTS